MENPYGAKVQEQLKITNLRVQLLPVRTGKAGREVRRGNMQLTPAQWMGNVGGTSRLEAVSS